MTRSQAIAAKCRDCIFDRNAAGQWTAQVAACPCTDCALWGFRPVPRTAPDWLKSRDPASLPETWGDMSQDVAVRFVSGAVERSGETWSYPSGTPLAEDTR